MVPKKGGGAGGCGGEYYLVYEKAYEISMLEIISKHLLEQRQGHFVYIMSGCFHTLQQRWLVMTEIAGPTKSQKHASLLNLA